MDQLILIEERFPIVDQQEHDGGVCGSALVAVNECVVLTKVEEVCRG
jgi:hypothetical protein